MSVVRLLLVAALLAGVCLALGVAWAHYDAVGAAILLSRLPFCG